MGARDLGQLEGHMPVMVVQQAHMEQGQEGQVGGKDCEGCEGMRSLFWMMTDA